MEILEAQKLRISRLGVQLEKVTGLRSKKGEELRNKEISGKLFLDLTLNKILFATIHFSKMSLKQV